MTKRLIIYLLRTRLGLHKGERFRFTNQKSSYDYYFFTDTAIMKYTSATNMYCKSSVSLNWLLDDNCKIRRLDE